MGELGINAWGLAVQLVAFIVFILLFWKYALGPITNMLDERSRRISESMAADAMKAEMARASVRNEEILAEARQQAQQIISQAREVSESTIAGRRRKPASRPRSTSRARRQPPAGDGTGSPPASSGASRPGGHGRGADREKRARPRRAIAPHRRDPGRSDSTRRKSVSRSVGQSVSHSPTFRLPTPNLRRKDTRGQQRGKTIRPGDLQSRPGTGDARHLGPGSGPALPRRRR